MNLDRKILNAASEKYICYQQSSFTNNAKPKVNLNRIETNNIKIPRLIKRYISIYKEIQFKQLYLFAALKKRFFQDFSVSTFSHIFFTQWLLYDHTNKSTFFESPPRRAVELPWITI